MKIALVTGTLLLAAAAFTANPPDEPQASTTKNSAIASLDAAKQSSTASRGAGKLPTADKRKIPCKTQENASLCYWTHGRLSIYEGSVPYRIWKIGTHRLLGVFSGPSHYPALTNDDIFKPELPPELYGAYEADNRRLKRETGISWAVPPPVFGDFEVCPLRPEQKGERQPVCIDSAKNIFVQRDY